MTAIRTKYLWKPCSHCGETTVCREVSQHYLLTHGACATKAFNGPPVIGEHGYFCVDCDPEANPPETEPFVGKSPLPGEDTFALDIPTRGRWVGIEHRVVFPWEPYLDGGISFMAYDVMDVAIQEDRARAMQLAGIKHSGGFIGRPWAEGPPEEDRRRVQVSHPNLTGALSEKRAEPDATGTP